MKKQLLVVILWAAFQTGFSQNKTYYISAAGNDSQDGLTAYTAWRTLSKVNLTDLEPGDKILL